MDGVEEGCVLYEYSGEDVVIKSFFMNLAQLIIVSRAQRPHLWLVAMPAGV